jgi:hypothetical protein
MKKKLFLILFFFFSLSVTDVFAQKKADTLAVLKILMDDLNPLKVLKEFKELKLTQKDIDGMSRVIPPNYIENTTDTFPRVFINAIDKDVLNHYGLNEMVTKQKLAQISPINIGAYLQSQYYVISSSLLPRDSLFLENLKKIFAFIRITTPVFINNYCIILIHSISYSSSSQVILFKKERKKWQKVPTSVKWHLPGRIDN